MICVFFEARMFLHNNFYAFLCMAGKEKPKGNGINSAAALCRSLLRFEFAALQSLH
jgi:hypothetical protein